MHPVSGEDLHAGSDTNSNSRGLSRGQWAFCLNFDSRSFFFFNTPDLLKNLKVSESVLPVLTQAGGRVMELRTVPECLSQPEMKSGAVNSAV